MVIGTDGVKVMPMQTGKGGLVVRDVRLGIIDMKPEFHVVPNSIEQTSNNNIGLM